MHCQVTHQSRALGFIKNDITNKRESNPSEPIRVTGFIFNRDMYSMCPVVNLLHDFFHSRNILSVVVKHS